MKPDITAIILTKNEDIHIARAVESAMKVARRVIVVDSGSTDSTRDIARAAGAEVVEMPWPGNQAAQFNRGLDTLPIDSQWILRLDADEWLSEGLINEIYQSSALNDPDVAAIRLPLGRYFLGKRLRFGIANSIKIIRLFRKGHGRYAARLMDEHLEISGGKIVDFKHRFFDDNRRPLSYFIAKHNGYALREAANHLINRYGLTPSQSADDSSALGSVVQSKRRQKSLYYRLPPYWRAAAYFGYRYFVRLGFIDGRAGFLWDFMQGWWYRNLVDATISEILSATDSRPEAISQYLRDRNLL